MRPSSAASCLALSVLALAAFPAAAPAQMMRTQLTALAQWKGALPDAALRDARPRKLFIANQQAWVALWTAWRGKEAVPAVDFTTELILVETTTGQMGFTELSWWVDEVGNVTNSQAPTIDNAGGFSYVIRKVNRNGITSVYGVFLPCCGSGAP